MSAPDGIEQLGRIDFMPLSFLTNHRRKRNELSKLFLPYIGSFERLLNDIFPLPNLEYKRHNPKELKSQKICDDFKTLFLKYLGWISRMNGTDKTISIHKTMVIFSGIINL